MKRHTALTLVLAPLFGGCGPATLAPESVPPSAIETVEHRGASSAVAAVLDDWHDAAAHSDEARYFGHFAANGVFLGTDATERWNVEAFRAYARPRFAEGQGWHFRPKRRVIARSVNGRTAWVDEDLVTENLGAARGSAVLVWLHGSWKIAHYNLSVTVPNERFGEVRELLDHRPIKPQVFGGGCRLNPRPYRGTYGRIRWEALDPNGHTGDPGTRVTVHDDQGGEEAEVLTDLAFVQARMLTQRHLLIVGANFMPDATRCPENTYCGEIWDLARRRTIVKALEHEIELRKIRNASYEAALVFPIAHCE